MPPLFRRVSLAAAIWAGTLGIGAQTLSSTGSIYGTALDEQGAPLPGVAVKLLGAGEWAPVQTDERGNFRFLYLSPGTYAVLSNTTSNSSRCGSSTSRSTPGC